MSADHGPRAPAVARHGWIILDKEPGPSSAQAVAKVRRITGVRKAGHGGTLDPTAEGVLPIALGEATKTVSYVMDADKVYRFTIRWGERRDTDDAAGRIVATSDRRPTAAEVAAALPAFVGDIRQVPPDYSAIKVAGRRAYDLARRDAAPVLAPRTVRVTRFDLVDRPDADHCRLEVECGKGTYIRALVRDLAAALGTAGHVAVLRRVRVGPFDETAAVTLGRLAEMAAAGDLDSAILSVQAALARLPTLDLDAGQAARVRNGQVVPLLRRPAAIQDEEPFCTRFAGRPIALARVAGGEIRPIRVFNY